MAKVLFHKREFDKTMQQSLSNECLAIRAIWRDFDKHPILKREMDMGLMMVKKLYQSLYMNM